MDIMDLDGMTVLQNESGNLLMMSQMVTRNPAPRILQRRELNLADKVQFIKFYEAASGRLSIRSVAKKFNIGRTSALRILKKKDEYLKHYALNVDSNRRRIRLSKFHEVNLCTWKWFMVNRFRQLPVTGPRLQEKALKFATKLGITSFKASNGWLDSFKKAYNIQQQLGKSPEDGLITNFDWKSKLPNLTSDHGLENIFSYKVTPLYYRALPEKSVIGKLDEDSAEMLGERLTVMLCCSILGEKLPAWVLGSCSHQIPVEDQIKSGVVWKTTSDANLNHEILTLFLENLNSHLQQKSRKIILFLDYLLVDVPELSHITIYFFPMNTAAKSHPMDLGILHSFKVRYRTHFLSSVMHHIDQLNGDETFHPEMSVSDSLLWIQNAWEAVDKNTIVKSYENAGFTLPNYMPLSGESDKALHNEMSSHLNMFARAKQADVMSVNDYITFDKLSTPDSPSEDELEDQIVLEVISERNASPEELLSLNIETDEEELQYPEDDKTQLAASELTHDEALEMIGKIRNFALTKENCLLPLINDLKGIMETLISEQAKKK